MKIKLSNLIPVTLKVVTWMLKVFNLQQSVPLAKITLLAERLDSIRKNRGAMALVLICKNARLMLWKYLAGTPIKVPGVRSTRDGLPIILGDLIPLIRAAPSPALLRVVSTLLTCTRALSLGKNPDIDSITSDPKGGIAGLGKHVGAFWAELGYGPSSDTVPKSLLFKKFHQTCKTGPNKGGNALWTSLADLQALQSEQLECIKAVGGGLLHEKVQILKESLRRIPEIGCLINTDPGTSTRKLAYFPDKETKVRVIAIGDYFTQAALKPLHSYLFKVLRKIPQDCTFDQGSFWEKIKGSDYYASVDLTAATDRFPISLIARVLYGRLPDTYVNSWVKLMIGQPFEIDGKSVYYRAGNPMGFYSSWASFAVAHHYLMFYVAKELGIKWSELKYCLLGDDIVICHKGAASLYKSILTQIGVEWSPSKTYESSHFCEFAKRLFYKGVEISPFPISALGEVHKRYYLFVNLLLELECKGWESYRSAAHAISAYYGMVWNMPSVFRRKIEIKSFAVERVMLITRGAENAGVLLTEAFRKLGFPYTLTDDIAKGILENIAVEQFANSNPASASDKTPKRKCVGLGYLAENLTCLLTGLDDNRSSLGFDLLYALPHLSVYGQIEEMYMNLSKEAHRISTVGGGDWPLLMKTMALPWDDRIFIQRSSHAISYASSVLVKSLQERGKVLHYYLEPDHS